MKKLQKTNAMRILEQKKFEYHTYSYVPSEDGKPGESALQIGKPAEMIYKTLVCVAKSKQHYVFVIPVLHELDLKKAAKAVKEKSVELIHVKELLPLTGYVRGGCSPFGMKKLFPTVIDASALSLDTIIVSAGKIGQQIETSKDAFESILHASFLDVVV
ncbi:MULTISPECIES: Cys-tRNA(Pro) deacylase [Breznakia]|uniref:Cys-tRNA(Pro)/Cys-tRNA(Cys) deacylase n=1 Tax=Breznakia blatticola TaxID=1754012 RepID=A0A4R7ZK70_9FIRM|nr:MULTISPECIES: Cys-tRNA(Pro) deacylase [Breznakia]MDH6366267.1 Cys-tRNA(Pro)/Cys-tRNA(Cys) deacylase [Breznakia sp. PH1-1]MDH6403360.1 Cys-tRNA(Pro)/Cys-tRNA(Cys) deacylase [Breznakia sp. PF1-11]MDH6411069.1 Cys-tRNA(Pro)/Cys-tRNA(Cys) deacylase [Breznakia sp. PFB1-11]MDH6413433.1 Cys-tRNA(Pro)/Cys-tRNA(Cys) deacylase [Breznakia sp. PFB1-14]MDH6416778.1 Cys-tRNA(Pro)/Cys-tRNA(Cys) deacylase [Breznakia sp. PFB1-4]